MAEFIREPETLDDGFGAMGKPIPLFRKQAALDHCKSMGLNGSESWDIVGKTAGALERDEPYQAMKAATGRLDLTGAYRIMAVLLTAPETSQ